MAIQLNFGAVVLSAALLNAANGLVQTFLPIRMTAEGFSPTASGLMLMGHAVGFLAGCLGTPAAIRSIGHIRAFAAAAALMAVTSLAFAITVEPWYWTLLRLLTGLSSAAMFSALESWLNAGASHRTRGSVIGFYIVASRIAAVLGQVALTLPFEPTSFFMIGAAIYCLCLIPMATTLQPSPDVSRVRAISLFEIYRVAPAALAGCLVAGLANSAIGGLVPVYATQIDLPRSLAAPAAAAMTIGNLLSQWPLGRISDRIDRRRVILAIALGAMAASLALLFGRLLPLWALFAAFACWGGFAYSLYAVCIAHANDRAHPEQVVSLASGLLLLWAMGSAVGPLVASSIMEWVGPEGLFGYSLAIYVLLASFIVWRVRVREPAGPDRPQFVEPLTTTPLPAQPPAEKDPPRS